MRSLPRSHGTGEKDFPSQGPGRARAGAGGGLCAPPPAPAPVRASGSASSYVLGRRSLARNAAIRRSRPRGWLPNEILMIESGLLLWENGGTDGPAESEIGPSKPLLDCGLRGVVVRLRRINRLWLWHFDIDTRAVFLAGRQCNEWFRDARTDLPSPTAASTEKRYLSRRNGNCSHGKLVPNPPTSLPHRDDIPGSRSRSARWSLDKHEHCSAAQQRLRMSAAAGRRGGADLSIGSQRLAREGIPVLRGHRPPPPVCHS